MHHKIRTTHNKLNPILEHHYANHTNDLHERDSMISTAKLVAEYNSDKNNIVSLFHYNDFSVSYLCKNGRKFFPTKSGIPYKKALFYGLDISQADFPTKIFEWLMNFTTDFKSIGKKPGETMIYICGLKLKNKEGDFREYFIRQRILSKNKMGLPISCISYLTDVTHLLRQRNNTEGNFFWSRIVCGKLEKTRQFRSSQQNVGLKKDIVSKRELEVLKLIAVHKESREIARLLNISINTVDKHRKNMLARTRVKDTTALVQLCKMTGLL